MKKLSAKHTLLLADALILPGLLFCRWLANFLLTETDTTCLWLRLGGRCITCGGTHFVRSLLNFRIGEAFAYNEFLFVLTVLFLVSYILLHLMVFWKVKFAKVILKKVYSIPGLIVGVVFALGFFLVRNIPVFLRIAQLLASK